MGVYLKEICNYIQTTQGYNNLSSVNAEPLFFENLIWLTTVETAIYLRRFTKEGLPSSGAIRTLVCRGRLRARKYLGKLYFKRSELDHLIETSELRGGRVWQ